MMAMAKADWISERFEEHRPHLRAVAYRMLGSQSEADDAVQEAWLRLSRSDSEEIENLGGWLTTVVARVALDMLRSRKARHEVSLDSHVPQPIVSAAEQADPEHEALMADSVGLALLVVLETLAPAERLAFVLHDMFAVPFDEIAPIVDRTPAAARQLASRARRRVRGAAPAPDADQARRREVVDAFVAATREGDLDALVAVLDPEVVLRADAGPKRPGLSRRIQGAEAVASSAASFARTAPLPRAATVNGAPGLVTVRDGTVISVAGFTIRNGRIGEIDILADPDRLAELDLGFLDASAP